MKPALSLLLVAVFGLCGCAHKKTGGASPPFGSGPAVSGNASSMPERAVVPEIAQPGKVASFNKDGRFVVLNFLVGHTPAMGQRLFVYRQGLQVGEVKVSGPQREELIVADLVAGEAEAGDEVRDK